MEELDLGATVRGFSSGQKVFSRYVLKQFLGRGGMGVVWLAQDEELDREVALKFLPEMLAVDPEALADLKRETKRNLELTSPYIVRIYDFVTDKRTAAIAMEYIDGQTLSVLKLTKPDRIFTTEELLPLISQICEALTYAHTRAKVVHRDIKPANLMLTRSGEMKITDFGIARGISDSVSRISAQAGSSGTPLYMSPQQMMGEKPSVTDDIYALGATLYELLTSKPPFHTGNIVLQLQSKSPTSLTARREELGISGEPIPVHWESTILSCLAKDPAQRPASAEQVLHLFAKPEAFTEQDTAKAQLEPDEISWAPSVAGRSQQLLATLLSGLFLAFGGVFLLYFWRWAAVNSEANIGMVKTVDFTILGLWIAISLQLDNRLLYSRKGGRKLAATGLLLFLLGISAQEVLLRFIDTPSQRAGYLAYLFLPMLGALTMGSLCRFSPGTRQTDRWRVGQALLLGWLLGEIGLAAYLFAPLPEILWSYSFLNELYPIWLGFGLTFLLCMQVNNWLRLFPALEQAENIPRRLILSSVAATVGEAALFWFFGT